MVDMSMGQNNCIDAGRIERKLAVTIPSFIAPAMENPAVKEKSFPTDTENVHGASDRASSALKLKMHKDKNSISVCK